MTLGERADALGLRCRQVIAAQASDAMIATEVARSRLLAWVASGGLDRPAPDIRTTVRYFGDPEMLPPVVDAIGCLAPPARDFVLTHTAILGTGWSTRGWTGAMPVARQVIVLDGSRRHPAAVCRIAVHEYAHVWLEDPLFIVTAAGRTDLGALAVHEGWITQADRHIAIVEARAEALAAVWLRGTVAFEREESTT